MNSPERVSGPAANGAHPRERSLPEINASGASEQAFECTINGQAVLITLEVDWDRITQGRTARKLGEQYLAQRGLTPETVAARFGIEIEPLPEAARFQERIGIALPNGVETVLWIPVRSKAGAHVCWIARLLPQPREWPKFLCAKDSGGPPWMMPQLYDRKTPAPLIVTEGPIKAMAVTLAGYDAVGLNGVWCAASPKNGDDPLCLRPELESLRLLGSKVCLAFDADQTTKPEVRHALIRLYLLLTGAGAEVYQLTTWHLDQGKGIDDYLAAHGSERSAETLGALIATAKPFSETLSSTTPLDAHLVQKELPLIEFGVIVRDQLIRQLAHALDVRVDVLRELLSGPLKAKPELGFAENYEPWTQSVDAEELFNEIMVRIAREVTIEPHQLWVCGLWVMFTWIHPQMDFSPVLYVTGPTMECGKTTLLNVIGKMVRRPAKTANVSAAAVYRLSELYHPSLLMDEAQDQLNDRDFWLVIKSGHTPGEYAIRCNPNTSEPEAFDVFCPKLLAGIGRAGAQIMSRSIIVEMERKDGERDRSVKESDPAFVEIRRKLARWANDAGDLRRFQLPKGSQSRLRHRDNWESLYRVACGVSQAVARQLVNFIPSFVDEEQDYATYLLDSLRKLYREHGQLTKDGFMGSEAIVEALNRDKEAPWYAKDDKGLSVRALSDRLRRYKVKPAKVWQPDINKELRGYPYIDCRPRHNDLKRVFEQYLPTEDQK
jgi:putative DNA primase/helicase